MEIPQQYLNKFKAVVKKRPDAEEFDLADQIYQWSSKTIAFGRIRKMIKLNGIQCVRECQNEAMKSDAKNPIALFLHLMKKNKTIWQD